MQTIRAMNVQTAIVSSDRIWEQEILPALERYIRIPNKSPAFDPDWVRSGHMDAAVKLITDWCQQQAKAE